MKVSLQEGSAREIAVFREVLTYCFCFSWIFRKFDDEASRQRSTTDDQAPSEPRRSSIVGRRLLVSLKLIQQPLHAVVLVVAPRVVQRPHLVEQLAGGDVTAQASNIATHEYALTAGYFTEYPEDIKLIGLSFNTQLQWGGVGAPGNAPWVLTVCAFSTAGTYDVLLVDDAHAEAAGVVDLEHGQRAHRLRSAMPPHERGKAIGTWAGVSANAVLLSLEPLAKGDAETLVAKRTANLGLTLTSNPPPIAQEKELSEPLKAKPSALRCAPPNRTCPKGVSLGLMGKRTIGPNRYV